MLKYILAWFQIFYHMSKIGKTLVFIWGCTLVLKFNFYLTNNLKLKITIVGQKQGSKFAEFVYFLLQFQK